MVHFLIFFRIMAAIKERFQEEKERQGKISDMNRKAGLIQFYFRRKMR